MTQRLFTVDEANALIPRLEIVMGELQRHSVELRRHFDDFARENGQAPDTISTGALVAWRPQLQEVVESVGRLLVEIDSHGVQFKGIDLGLIDFPAEHDGELVLLCWQFGEKEITYYHLPDAGFTGRKPLHPGAPGRGYLQ